MKSNASASSVAPRALSNDPSRHKYSLRMYHAYLVSITVVGLVFRSSSNRANYKRRTRLTRLQSMNLRPFVVAAKQIVFDAYLAQSQETFRILSIPGADLNFPPYAPHRQTHQVRRDPGHMILSRSKRKAGFLLFQPQTNVSRNSS